MRNPVAFDVADRNITPYQRRVLNTLTDTGQSIEDIACKAGLEKWYPGKAGGGNTTQCFRSLGPNVVGTRAVLGWLASKGLAVRDGKVWMLSSESQVTVDAEPARARA